MTTLRDFEGVLGHPSDTFLLGSHNFMVTALGSCVKWALHSIFMAIACDEWEGEGLIKEDK